MKNSKRILSLDRPLAVFDLETTGKVPDHDRIVEIAIVKIYPDGSRRKFHTRVNPKIPIPPEATKVHGICDDDVRDKPSFRRIGSKVAEFMSKCDLAGFNLIRFDIPLLQKEFERSDIPFSLRGRRVVDAYKIYITREPRNLTAAVNYYCDREHRDSHSALHDARACWNVLQAQLERYEDLSSDLDDLHDFCNPIDPRYVDSGRKFEWRHKRAVFAFGKHQGKSLHFVAKETADYLEWMLQSDFPSDTLAIVGKALKGVFPKQT